MSLIRIVFALVLAGLVSTGPASAQTSSLTGRVVDSQGAAIANADVTVLTAASQRVRATRSAADGSFTVQGLTPAEYVVVVHAPGFADFTQQTRVGDAATRLDVTLSVAGLAEDVTVQGALTGTAATGKTNLPLRDLPLTIQGVTSSLIQEQGANDLTAALQNVPGVYAFTNYGIYEGYTFRGFLDLFPSLANQLVDGVRHQGNRVNTQLTDIERVEVLKGPSSALYGGGAIGATVNLIRKKPSAEPAYDVSAAVGSWKTGRGTFGATGRLNSDALLYRLDVGVEGKEGYRHNDTNRVQVTPSIAWGLGGKGQLNVYYTFTRDHFNGDAGIPLLNTDGGSLTSESVFPDVPRDRNYRTPNDFETSLDNNLQVAFARQLNDHWGFRNTFSYRPVKDDYLLAEYMFVEEDASTVFREYLQFTHHRKPLTDIAEVTGHFSGRVEHNIVAGWEGVHFPNHTDTIGDIGTVEATSIDLYNPVETQGPISEPITRIAYTTENTNGLYAQDNLSLGPKLKAMLGARMDFYRRRNHNTFFEDDTAVEGPESFRDANALTGRLGLVYQAVPTVDLYGSVANSFRPLTQAQPDGTTLDPERGFQVEFGQRFHLLNDRLQLSTAIYHIARTNVAISRPGGFYDQASEITSNGFEADVTTALASNWRITGGYGFTSAKYGDYIVDGTNLQGNSSIMAPRHIFNVWTAYDWANGFGVNVGVRAQSDMFIDSGNEFTIGGYGLLNLGARYRRGPMEYALTINNLTDTEYFASVLYDSQMYPGEPINVLGTVRIRLR